MDTTTSAALFTNITLPFMRLYWVTIVLVVLLPSAVIVGHKVGSAARRRRAAVGRIDDAPGNDVEVGAILALLGLLLAFSFGNALSTSQATKSAITNEAAALGTAFLRADYLPDPGRTNLQTALLDYARTRVAPPEPLNDMASVRAFLDNSLREQEKIWPLTLSATADPLPAPLQAFVAGAVNDALDAHLYRVETLAIPVSEVAQTMMLVAALVSLYLIGNQAGHEGRTLNWRSFVLASILFVVMLTIVDTQRTNDGLIRVSTAPISATIFDMEQALKGRI
ncbi:hypothetical protein ACRDNQ_09410 [Palleronia sp. KMU-117]|uniref:bestrophin-like domain n=1 Tax=Palleronia sp. KMU-117 TaxID=3434108 RepID=UPI003D739596